MKSVGELLKSLLNNQNNESTSLRWTADSTGLGLDFSERDHVDLAKGKGNDLGLHQFIAMNSILEEGLAEKIPTGAYLSSENAVRLDENFCRLAPRGGVPLFKKRNLLWRGSGPIYEFSTTSTRH